MFTAYVNVTKSFLESIHVYTSQYSPLCTGDWEGVLLYAHEEEAKMDDHFQ